MIWKDEDVNKAVNLFVSKYNRMPMAKECGPSGGNNLPSYKVFNSRFGGLINYANVNNITMYGKWNLDIDIDKAIDIFIDKYKRTPKDSELNTSFNLPTWNVFKRKYGGYNKYLKSRNIKVREHTKYNIKEVDNLIDVFISENGRTPTLFELTNKNELPTQNVFVRLSGSYTNYLSNRNILSNYIEWSKQSIADKISLFIVNNTMLSVKELAKLSYENIEIPSQRTIHNHFGGLKQLADYMKIEYIGDVFSISEWEKDVGRYIESITKEKILYNDRTMLTPKELDIYIPELKLAIECNGEYYHSIEFKNKEYHINKTNKCKDKHIQLIHLWMYEWENNKDEVKNYLYNIIMKKEFILEQDIVEVDNMKPINYTNIKLINITEPKIIKIGRHEVWNCGFSIYKKI